MTAALNPLWGIPYLVIFYLVFLGIGARKSKSIFIGKMFIVPGILLALSIYGLFVRCQGWSDLLVWVLFLGIGIALGFGLVDSWKVRANRKKLIIKLPGSSLILMLVFAALLIKVFFVAYYATHADVDINMRMADLILFSLITGILIGQPYSLVRKFAKARHESVIKSSKKVALKKAVSKKVRSRS